jgi:hypothetical protein
MYRRRSTVERGDTEPAAFNDNNNMNPIYENTNPGNENPLYSPQGLDDGFGDAQRELA